MGILFIYRFFLVRLPLFVSFNGFAHLAIRVVNIHPGAGAFVVTSGAVLGVFAAFLWTAQGSLMMAYPTEAQKGIFIGIFWAIFNLGGVVGSAVAFGQNFNSTVSFNCPTIQSPRLIPSCRLDQV
jgi:sugar phosphate permease